MMLTLDFIDENRGFEYNIKKTTTTKKNIMANGIDPDEIKKNQKV